MINPDQMIAMAKKAERAIYGARVKLVLPEDATSVFFASLAMRLKLAVDWSISTACVDGKTMSFNPTFVEGLHADELLGVMMHEVLHCAYAHFSRRGDRDMRKWNIATDLAINSIIIGCGKKLPACGLWPGKKFSAKELSEMSEFNRKLAELIEKFPKDQSAEKYYSMLPDEPNDKGGGGGGGTEGGSDDQPGGQGGAEGNDDKQKKKKGDGSDGGGSGSNFDPGGCGGVKDAGDGSEAEQRMAESDWQQAVSQAVMISKARGALPGSIEKLVKQLLAPRVDWKAVLMQYLTKYAFDEYTWRRPNRRYISSGLYLPSVFNEVLGHLVIGIDTSGSITTDQVTRFLSEIQGILEVGPTRVTVMLHHVNVYRTVEWTPSEGPLDIGKPVEGGTSHKHMFKLVEELDEPPVCAVFLTDLESDVQQIEEPEYPCLWCVINNPRPEPHFGEALTVEV